MLEKMSDSLLYALSQKYKLMHTTDLHSHLIPNIDDGVRSLEASITIINQLNLIGFKKLSLHLILCFIVFQILKRLFMQVMSY